MGYLDRAMTLEEYNALTETELRKLRLEEYGGIRRRDDDTDEESA